MGDIDNRVQLEAGAVVDGLIDAWRTGSVDEIMSFFADGITYENVPTGAISGYDDVREHISDFLKRVDEVDMVVRRQIESESNVFNERVDRFRVRGKWIEIPVAGLFQVRNGKIVLWRDYFDLETFRRQL